MEKYRIPKSPDLTSRHLPSTFGDDDIAVVFEESQKRFSLHEQGVSQFTQAAGTSRRLNVTLPNHSNEPMISSQIPNVCNTGENFPISKKEPSEKKRLCDKAYRERLKRERKMMETDLVMVGSENEDLKRENGRLRSEKDLMDQYLQTRAAENQILKTEICYLRGKISHQQVLVDAFSRKLLLSNHEDHQLSMLRQERARLHEITWNDQMEEKRRILDTKINLEHQNRTLKIQIQALCEKIHNDKNHE
ncbi:uncharacterized protein LOC119989560 isoform X1 [Tripterygium wilfordii]|uniref:uncharacterized protein LOC119989560 isoform X1 n=1 Tax=Tripterygium wilfordii TaxID=458696 RepID=UPI0018F83EA5|nr:uncharacterized protein LOC119989560 isoform X1 [Tripterygium wilfordii]